MDFKEIKEKLAELSSIDFIIELLGYSISEETDEIDIEDLNYSWEDIEEDKESKLIKHIKNRKQSSYKILDLKGLLSEHLGEYKIVEKSYFHDGYSCFGVFYFKEHDVYMKVNGYYSSYNGTSWDSITEVKPKEKTIIVYENV